MVTNIVDVPTGSDTLRSAQRYTDLFLPLAGEPEDQFGAEPFLMFIQEAHQNAAAALNAAAIQRIYSAARVLASIERDTTTLHPQTDVSATFYSIGEYVIVSSLRDIFPESELSVAGPTPDTPARVLKDLSGMDAGRLAQVFGVSRTTFHQWASGATTPRGDHMEHLLEVLPLVQEAALRRPPQELAIWLKTPVEPAGPKPLDLLGDNEYMAFKGFLHRQPIEERLMARPPSTRRVATDRSVRPSIEDITTRIVVEDETQIEDVDDWSLD